MALIANVIYDFDAQPGSGELTIRTGEVLTVTRQDVGDGWWEGLNSRGETGLFPEAYVEISADGMGPPAMPPPPLPTEMTTSHSGGGFSNGSFQQPPPPPQLANHQDSQVSDVYDDDWSDDESVDQDPISTRSNNLGGSGREFAKNSSGEPMRGGTVKKNMFRFSNFVKSGTEGYILNTVKIAGQPAERHEVILGHEGPIWTPVQQPYTCNVDKPKKESKMHGLKSFVAYQLTPSFTGIQVSRRYKHFDWLHQRLTEKYAILPIPPLPDKTVTGRFEEDLIEHRMQLLQLWVAKLCRHPVLSHSDVWIHFLTTTDDKKWKQGKRKAEKDEYTGGNFFLTVSVPAQPLDQNDVEQKLDNFDRMTRSLNNSVIGMHGVAADSAKKMAGPYKREWQKMGSAITSLGMSFEMDQNPSSQSITQAVKKTADCYMNIGKMFEEQPRKDLDPLMDNLFAYKGMLATVPDIVQVHKSASQKLRDHEKMMAEGKISQSEADSIKQRVDTISYAVLAEVNHFQEERVTDFKETMSSFLESQISFYQQVIGQLQDSLEQFK